MMTMSNGSHYSLASSTNEDNARRKSVFYIPLFESFDNYRPLSPEEKERLKSGLPEYVGPRQRKKSGSYILSPDRSKLSIPKYLDSSMTESESDVSIFSSEKRVRRPLSSTLSSNEAISRMIDNKDNRSCKYVADSRLRPTKQRLRTTTSCDPRIDRMFTPLSTSMSSSRLNNSPLSVVNQKTTSKMSITNSNLSLIPNSPNSLSPSKEKSKTLPQNLTVPLPIRSSSSSSSIFRTPKITVTPDSPNRSPGRMPGLNFIRRSRSTKLSRSNSLLRSIAAKHIEEGLEESSAVVTDLKEDFQLFRDEYSHGDPGEVIGALIRRNEADVANSPLSVRRRRLDVDDDVAVHSDTSYEKACRRGSAPSTPGAPGAPPGPQHSPSRLANFFFSKRSFRTNPLKRTKSANKLERERALAPAPHPTHPATHALRTSRSHESLLSAHSPAVSTLDLGPPHQVEIRALHSSVLNRPHCFALSAENRAPRYFACASRKQRDRWMYSLRQAARPEEMYGRRCERSVKLWLLEAKAIPPKKRYYCEILLDDTLYARTSSKLKTELCFWGEVYEFNNLPPVGTIVINVHREPERKTRKRDKHHLVGSVRIPVDDVSSRYLNERWYPLSVDKDKLPPAPPPAPSLRIKCRYQSIDILPIDAYADFLHYIKANYKKLCECLEPVIGVKAKEDIGGALVLVMAACGLAPRYLADVVALDVRRTGDHSLTFRGNSLATKSMEAYLKLVGDQYLQDTLSDAVCTASAAGTDCEVDPLRAGSASALRRQQVALRDAVELAWRRIALSAHHLPPQLRDCFATFRERLSAMGRDDISDNLISASIFLRFLCPAILSPSLFGITHEYPNERAARNLTLVAKTLQTLANFTRFQGKEAFMEFLNDFLEREAPQMKTFLREISSRCPEQQMYEAKRLSNGSQTDREPGNTGSSSNGGGGTGSERRVQPEPEWAPHVDLGRQLATLHSLLADSLTKLSPARLQELDPLSDILDDLSKRQLAADTNTPLHITDNIFRFNDPTCASPPKGGSEGAPPPPSFAHSSPLARAHAPEPRAFAVARSPSFNPRAATLPRHHPPDHTSQYNNKEHCVNLKVVQIGFDHPDTERFKPPYNHYDYKERSPAGDSINRNYCASEMQNLIRDTATLEELSDLLKYADDADEDKNKKNAQNNNNNKPNYTTNGSNVSISQLSNVASSGYQSFATYSQSSSPVETAHPHPHENGHPHRYSQGNYKRDKFYKNPVQQKIDYDIQKYGIQNFTTDNGQNNNEPPGDVAPLVFTNPVYDMEDARSPAREPERDKRSSKRCPCGSSSSSVDDETTDNLETNSEEGSGTRDRRAPRKLARDPDPHRGRDESAPSLRKGGKTRMPRTNPMLSYSTNNHLNLKHFGQRGESLYESKPHHITSDGYQMTRSDSNVEEVNKEMYRLQISRSQKALYNMERERESKRADKYVIPENLAQENYPLDRAYSGARVSSTRLNEEPAPETYYRARDGGAGAGAGEERPGPAPSATPKEKLQRRLSLESARDLTDSSSDLEDTLYSTTGRRRANKHHRTIEQYEHEIERLKCSVELLRGRLGPAEPGNEQTDAKMKAIISRLICVEDELRREQRKMAAALSHKQRVIEAQEHRIAALDEANTRLLSALVHLQRAPHAASQHHSHAELQI